jgi:hypothetical protein
MPRRRERPPHEPTTTLPAACADCGQVGTMRVEGSGRRPDMPYLCAACLALRVAQVQSPPPSATRGRPKRRPA